MHCKNRRLTSIIILLVLVMLNIFPLQVKGKQKVVRVGCVDIENFLSVDKNGIASGYGVEYLKKISSYTGWKYEYIKGSWSDCLKWLKEGKIDLLCPAEYSEDRAAKYLFSEKECCLDYAALVGRKSEERFYFEDYAAYNGMCVGMIKENYLNAVFERYASEHGFSYQEKYYETGQELTEALEQGEVDAIVNGNMEYNDNQKLLAKIEYMSAYFITSHEHKELMHELNQALHKIFLENPYYTASLHEKYYESIEGQSIEFTREEADYIKNTGEIPVLFERNNAPFEWYDSSKRQYRGVYADIIQLIEKESGLKFKYLSNNSAKNTMEAVKGGKTVILADAYDPVISQPIHNIIYTHPYYDCSYTLIGRKRSNLNLDDNLTIAIPVRQTGLQSLMEKEYQSWKIVTYEQTKSCLNAVLTSKADLAIVSSLQLSVNKKLLDESLVAIDGTLIKLPVSLGLPEKSNPLLISVLNKAIRKVGEYKINQCAFNSILSYQEKYTLMFFLEEHPFYTITGVVVIIITIGISVFAVYHSTQQKKQNRLLSEKNKQLEEAIALQEQLRKQAQIDALTGLKNKSTAERMCQYYLDHYPDSLNALMIIDLDNFKQVNDVYGHPIGDAVLKRMGEALLKTADKSDIVGRIGGDEFLLFVASLREKEQIEEYLKKIYNTIHESGKEQDQIPFSCSIGVIVNDKYNRQFSKLFSEADKALYEAKKKGKNQYIIVK